MGSLKSFVIRVARKPKNSIEAMEVMIMTVSFPEETAAHSVSMVLFYHRQLRLKMSFPYGKLTLAMFS